MKYLALIGMVSLTVAQASQHANYSDEIRNLLVNGTYVLLDKASGEYDVMTSIRYIDHRELPDDPEAQGLYKFEDLRTVFDEYKSTVAH